MRYMTVKDILDYVDEVKQNTFSRKTKLIWLNELEYRVQTDVMLLSAEGVQTIPDDDTHQLIVPVPWSEIYYDYLFMKLSEHLEESSEQNNRAATFNKAFTRFMRWWADTYNPSNGRAIFRGYYLKGDKGDPFAYENFTAEQLEALKGYTPVRGTDYWTVDDIAAIQSYIDDKAGGGVVIEGTINDDMSEVTITTPDAWTMISEAWNSEKRPLVVLRLSDMLYAYLTGVSSADLDGQTFGFAIFSIPSFYTLAGSPPKTVVVDDTNQAAVLVTTDSIMSDTSVNAVQNRVVKKYIDDNTQPKGDYALRSELFSGSYNDLENKPVIPESVTEQTVSNWGFTKNSGTYSKPSGGIPKTDLASDVQTSLGKADTALQEHQSLAGYATEAWVTGKGYQTETQVKATIEADSNIKANTSARHSHSNKSVLDGITSAIVTAWNNAVTWITTNGENVLSHITDGVRHITAAERAAWNGKSDFSGSYNDLTNKPTIPTVPTNEINANTAARHSHDNKTVLDGITAEKVSEWDGKNSITDGGGYFTSDTVEGALQEIGAELAGINTLLGSGIQISFTIDDETFSAVSGSTWIEWLGGFSRVVSETSGLTLYTTADGPVVADEAGVYAVSLDGSFVYGRDTIISGATYTIINYGG